MDDALATTESHPTSLENGTARDTLQLSDNNAHPSGLPTSDDHQNSMLQANFMDPHNVVEERNRKVKARMQYRAMELEKLASNLSMEPQRTFDENMGSSAKIKAVLELKALRLAGRQKKVTNLSRLLVSIAC